MPSSAPTDHAPNDDDAATVDSRTTTSKASTVKSRAHSRLASLGRLRSRASNQPPPKKQPETQLQSETRLVEEPVSPSDAGSHSHKPSDASTLSKRSSETTLSDDDIKSSEENASHSSFLLASSNLPGDTNKEKSEAEQFGRLVQPKSRTMHQTSSKLLRMTDDERPFTRDFNDLFSTLMVSLPLIPHRVRFSKIEHTFTTEEAMTNLSSLKFSQSNRMPDPKDQSRIVTTTTTTTFSMAREMARSICNRFLEARLIESAEGKTDFSSKNSVWQLTPKGMHILSRFCQRNGINQRHVNELLDSPRNLMQLVILEREPETDKIISDSSTAQVIFRRFAGDTGPNVKANTAGSDTDSINDYSTGLVGVKMHRHRRGTEKEALYVFNGKSAYDWLLDCCSLVDKREVFELATLFMQQGYTEAVGDDRTSHPPSNKFIPSKHALYAITQKGSRVAGWITSPNGSVNGDATAQQRVPAGVSRDSNTNRMTVIIRDPALRLLFREYLRETHCEENLAFYVEVKSFLADYESTKRKNSVPKLDSVRETLASAYSLYNAFLAPGSPCELNIDHSLRNALASRMTKAVGEDEQMVESLNEVAALFDQAQSSVFKLMASDSVPKFFREPKYAALLRDRNYDSMLSGMASTSVS